MNCAVLGATGPSGIALTKQLIALSGDGKPFGKVILLVRNKSKLPEDISSDPNVDVAEGKLDDVEFLNSKIKQCDVVFSTLGYTKESPVGYFSKAIQDVKQVLEARESPSKLIVLLGAALTNDKTDPKEVPFSRKFMTGLLGLVMGKPIIADLQKIVEIVTSGGDGGGKVEACGLRPPMLTNNPKTEKYQVDKFISLPAFAPKASRENCAHFMIKLATDKETWEAFKWTTPMILDQ